MPRQPPLRLINGTGAIGAAKAALAGGVLASPTSLRRALIGSAVRPGRLLADAQAHAPASDAEFLAATGAMFHPASTCRMGAANDAEVVVDPECCVYGVDGLRVADASVMPCIVSANTNIPTIMIAERVAEFIRRRWPAPQFHAVIDCGTPGDARQRERQAQQRAHGEIAQDHRDFCKFATSAW